MNLVKQNEAGLPDAVRAYGCKYRCLRSIAEFTEKRMLSTYDILTIYESFARKNNPKIMNKNCACGEEEHLIINNAFYRLRLDETRTARMVGSKDDKGKTWGEQKGDFVMYHWNSETDNGHFTLADSQGNEIFDPWKGKIKKEGLKKTLYYKVS